ADSGAMGGSGSAEFQVLVQSGEDVIAACNQCQYAANLEVATTPPNSAADASDVPAMQVVATPKQRTIEQVSAYLKVTPERCLKCLVYLVEKELVLVVVRGDHELNEIKLCRALGVSEVHLASAEDVKQATGAPTGFIGPMDYKAGRVLVDRDAAAVVDAITGANQADAHVTHVVFGRDYTGTVAELRSVKEGDACPNCQGKLALYRGIEAGHIFLLGTHYSRKMNATFLDEKGEKQTLVMGCYGIGVSRLLATAVEQHHDDNGIRWPMSIAPYHIHIVQLGNEPEVIEAVQLLERGLMERGIEVLIDDRDERPGVKFKDADLVGIPLRVTVGAKALAKGGVELKPRSETDPKLVEIVPLDAAVATLSERVAQMLLPVVSA
ncbi:MAG TPA: proline--tRNA ligase, partial [Polyangiaceae bacterium]